ncbi:MAG: UDP-N-acetylmuramate--L-alanine ligase [bacterium]|nr:UDP-N-acetylmuramate--L-alanine ligase [bacterium]
MIKYSRVKRIHFVGIGGSGMSGIAEVLHNMGFTVSGSDIGEGETVKRLKSLGMRVFLGHDAKNVRDAETLVYSSAVTAENVEVAEALAIRIPVIRRAEMLAELMRMKYAVTVAGTHGKTTTTSMVATIMAAAGKDPTYVVGGKLKSGESGAKLGKSDYLAAEADESDGSFLKLFPTLAVVTNIEDDHLDHYGTMNNLLEAFAEFGNKAPFYGSVILNNDCPNCRKIAVKINKRLSTYGIENDADIRAGDVENSVFGASFQLIVAGKPWGRIHLNCGGLHNISNALAAIAAAIEMGIEMPVLEEGFRRFYLPDRRFQVLFFNKNIAVIDDYAHHPTEIEATLTTLRQGEFKRVIVVFQPHRFTRLAALMDRFARSFSKAHQLIIAPLYSANQQKIDHVDSHVLEEKIKAAGFHNVRYIDSFDGILTHLGETIREGDVAAFLSAGNLTQTAHRFAKQMEDKAK